MGRCNEAIKEFLKKSSLHGVKFIIDEEISFIERLFWLCAVIFSWIASGMLIMSALDAFQNNAISFVVETSYRDWDTEFPAIVVCESKNIDRVQEVAETLWGSDHDFTMEEILNEIAYFRGESYHTIQECGTENSDKMCIRQNFSKIAKMVRSSCEETLDACRWNGKEFSCCTFFQPMQTELGVCYALNSFHVDAPTKKPKLNIVSNKFTGPGALDLEISTEANVYTIGAEDVPNLVTTYSEILSVGPYISYTRVFSIRNIENDPLTRDVSVEQRNCRYSDENILDVHKHYSYSACSVQCRKDKQMQVCNCTSHLMPNTPTSLHCNMDGLKCLNSHYEELSVVIAHWSTGKKGVVCDCMPSCTEVDITVVHDTRNDLTGQIKPVSLVKIAMAALPTERYKRNVVRGKLDLVVSMGGTISLFVGASLLSFVEIFYYFIVKPIYQLQQN